MPDKAQIKEYAIRIYNSPEKSGQRPDVAVCLKRIKKFCVKAIADDSLGSAVSAKWLCDNYYVIEREAKFLIKENKKQKHCPQRIYSYLDKLLFFTEYVVSNELVSSFFEVFSRNDFLSDRELLSVQGAIKALIIKRISQLCDQLEKKGGIDIASAEKSVTDEKLAKNLIISLRKSSVIDFSSFVTGYSPVERILRLDPSGIYPKMDKPTQMLYRKWLEKKAKHSHKSQVDTLREIVDTCSGQTGDKRHIGFYLYDKPNPVPYIAILSALFIGLYSFSIWLCRDMGYWLIALAVVFAIPVFETARMLCEWICVKIRKPQIIPKMKFDSTSTVPPQCRTLTVITSLLFGEKEDGKLFERLEKFYLANRDQNLIFGVMGDLCEAESEKTEQDKAIIDNAVRNIQRLNNKYGGGFFLFVRKRVYSKTQKCYMGYERKRGAIIELCRFLRGKDTTIDTFEGNMEYLADTQYILTLDSDTEVGMGQIFKLCSAMAHPLNKPVVAQKKGRFFVQEGYGIMQPVMSYSLSASGKTPFCILKSGAGGREIYSSAAFDVYQSFFGSGIFCGKGIFQVDTFLKVIDKAFGDDKILSHDILEGCLLRCGLVNDIVFTDSLPNNPISFFKREHRWSRGDVQAMAYSAKKVTDYNGNKTENPISLLSKFKLTSNISRIILPFFAVVSMVISLLCQRERVAVIGLMYIYTPFLRDIVSMAFGRNFQQVLRKFVADVISGIWSAFLNLLYDVSTLFHRCQINTDAVVRTIWRMKVSKTNLLQWTTADQADKVKSGGLPGYLWYMKYSVLAGIIFVALSGGGILRLMGIGFIISPIVCYLLSRPIDRRHHITPRQKETVTAYCRDMWKFFAEQVTADQNYLPPDNVQFSPVFSRAERCSPTNIGLYLLSVLSAKDFGFIDSDELYLRLNNTLTTVEKLEKYHGHLFNWYDNHTLEILGEKYVSTVDSGNFVTCLVALERGLLEYKERDGRLGVIIKRIQDIIQKTDFRVLYNPGRDLFYLGYDVSKETGGEGCYDLFMSESRTTGYFAIARGQVPKRHWEALGRILISRGFYIGAASWSGTTFEYFMPTLLLPVCHNSFCYEALQFAYNEQKRHCATVGKTKVWGSSECGFYDFDPQMNYQYKAVGAPFLSLKHEQSEELVISPYSSFLMLGCNYGQVLENLDNLKKLGMYSKYGFYEAVDFTPSRSEGDYARVESYMAHHVGMSIISCANSVFDNIFQKRFMSDANMMCAAELLEEKIPTDASIFNDIDSKDIPEKAIKSSYGILCDTIDAGMPRIALFSGYRSTLRVSDSGKIWLERWGEFQNRLVCNPPDSISETRPGFVTAVKINNKIFSPTAELCHKDVTTRFEYNRDSAGFNITDGKRLVNVSLTLSAQTCVLYTDITVNCLENDSTEYMIYLEPVLESLANYTAHPAFSALSMESEYDALNRVLLFRRRSRKQGDELYLAAGFCSEDLDYTFETRADKLFGHGENLEKILACNKEKLSSEVGACINPRLFVKVSSHSLRRKNTEKLCFMVLCASTREKAVNAFIKARQNHAKQQEKDALAVANTKKAVQTFTESMGKGDYMLLEQILGATSYRQRITEYEDFMPQTFSHEDLWKYSVSGDLPIVCVMVSDKQQLKLSAKMIMLHRLCALKGFNYDTVFLVQETQLYDRPLQSALRAFTAKYRSDYLVNKKGGLFFVSDQNAFPLFKAVSVMYLDGEQPEEVEFEKYTPSDIITLPDTSFRIKDYPTVLSTFGGDFINGGFVIDKFSKTPPLAYSHVMSNFAFGTVITHNSLGYTWFSNSQQRRLTRFENSPYDSFISESIYMIGTKGIYDLCSTSLEVVYLANSAVYLGRAEQTDYRIEVFIHEKMPVKSVRVTLSKPQQIFYGLRPMLGSNERYRGIYCVKGQNSISFGSAFAKERAMLIMPKETQCSKATSLWEIDHGKKGINDMILVGQTGQNLEFALCSVYSDRAMEYTREYLKGDFDKYMSQSVKMTRNLLAGMLKTSSPDQNPAKIMSDFWLPYQAVICRFLARSGLYQSGGAYGFRDQLQDCRIFFKDNPRIARRHIIRCASHQFEQGDVQHWWHNVRKKTGYHPGIRSKCSDDYLWLVFCLCEYLEKTADDTILSVKVKYISAPPLSKDESERYSTPEFSAESESIYQHCKRAIQLFEKRGLGSHGLPFIGSGDWNDGFNAVGEKGKGESVWLGLFARIVLEKFAVVAKKQGDDFKKYQALSDKIGYNIDKNAYNGKWFLRGFYDDGTPLGDEGCSECKIDLLPQAFSAICDSVLQKIRPDAYRSPQEYIQRGLDSAYEMLYDKQNQILRLFWPPFDRTDKNPGYIKSYAAGLRENGGQYTHGAIWGAMGFMSANQLQKARELTDALCPAEKATDRELFEKYKTEPYVVCGDVYSNISHAARGGWSWYTGSAAWYYQLIKEVTQ